MTRKMTSMDDTKEHKTNKVFPQTNLSWSQAYTLLINGMQVKRAAWRSPVQYIFIKNLDSTRDFFKIKLKFKTKTSESNWQPYHKDFSANDWCVVESKIEHPNENKYKKDHSKFCTLEKSIDYLYGECESMDYASVVEDDFYHYDPNDFH